MQVRQAVLDDAQAINRIYCAAVPKWTNLTGQETDFTHLTIQERWLHGGPWMSIETCAVWIAHLLQAGAGIPLVAEQDGEVVGQAEVFIGREADPFGFHMNISTLSVHPDQRNSGVGAALVKYIMDMAAVSGCDLVTAAYPYPEEFYAEMGFTKHVARYRVVLPAQEGRVFYRARDLLDTDIAAEKIDGWMMPMGRFQNAREEWERMRWSIWNSVPSLVEADWKRIKIELTGQPGLLHLHQRDDNPLSVTARLWTKNQMTGHMLTAVRDRAARLGYESISTLVPESLRSLLGEGAEGGQAQWLYARPVPK